MDRPNDAVLLGRIIAFIGYDTARRFQRVIGPLSFLYFSNNNIIPYAAADDKLLPNETFYARPAQDAFTFADVQAENGPLSETGYFQFTEWAQRGWAIRNLNNNAYCQGNLSLALQSLGTLNAAQYQGASGALTLLPTAGALIGSPATELWDVYMLMPIAGVLSMFLSLGGSLIPTQAGDYDQKHPCHSGLIPTTIDEERRILLEERLEETLSLHSSIDHPNSAAAFANRVLKRAQDTSGGGRYLTVWYAIAVQTILIAVIIIALYYGEIGGVVSWLCTVSSWMHLWYLLVVVTSVMENLAAMPFRQTWSMRVSKAPSNVVVSPEAPDVTAVTNVIDTLLAGYNIRGRVFIPRTAMVQPRSCFYAVISQEGISVQRAFSRIFAKWASVAVFVFGTALFASSQLISITVALFVLSLALGSGIMGRVIVLWISSQMNRDNIPIMHKIVRHREEAAEYLKEILKLEGVQIEIRGHIFINRRCVHRTSEWFHWSKYLGLLAAPYDITKDVIMGHDPAIQFRGTSVELVEQIVHKP